MDSASEELYFQKIQELVQDDDKIVTVSSVAVDLAVSLKNSRRLISKYAEDQRKLKSDDLTITYIISGTLKDNGRKGVFMIKESDLKLKRELFEPNPCEVIYSIQKNKNVDFSVIALVDMFGSTNIREKALHGSIVSKNCVQRKLKFKKLPSPPPPTLKGKSSFFIPKTEPGVAEDKSTTVSPKSERKGKSTGIADLFKAAASKPKTTNGSSAPVKTNKTTAKSGGLTGFLTNGAMKSSSGTSKTNVSNETVLKNNASSSYSDSQNSTHEEEILEVMDVEFKEELAEDNKMADNTEIKDNVTLKSKRKNKTQEKHKTSKRQRDKSKEVPSKKRKRIIERNDSDSDDMFEKENDTDDIIDRSDEEPERIPSPVAKVVVPKNKRRKAVAKNYVDEEGFIVTQMEDVYETASEDENTEPEPPKQEKTEVKTEIKPKAGDKKKPLKNQATLMSFFKKK